MYSYEISEGRRHKLKTEDAHKNSKLKVYKNSKKWSKKQHNHITPVAEICYD